MGGLFVGEEVFTYFLIDFTNDVQVLIFFVPVKFMWKCLFLFCISCLTNTIRKFMYVYKTTNKKFLSNIIFKY